MKSISGSHKHLAIQAGEGKEKWPLPTLLFLEKSHADSAPPAHILTLVNKSPSCTPYVLFKLLLLGWLLGCLVYWLFKGRDSAFCHSLALPVMLAEFYISWIEALIKARFLGTHQCESPSLVVPCMVSDPPASWDLCCPFCLWLVVSGIWFPTATVPLLPFLV